MSKYAKMKETSDLLRDDEQHNRMVDRASRGSEYLSELEISDAPIVKELESIRAEIF